VAAGAGVLGLPWVLSSSQANAATIVAIYAMIGLSLLVLTGWAGQISLGHFAFAAVGGYAAAASGLPMPAALVVGGLAGAALAVAVGVPSLRLGGLELSVTTLAVALGATAILLNPTYLGKALPDRLPRPGILDSERVFYYLTLVLLAGAVTAVVGLRRSRTARALIAARDNEPAAQTFGVAVVRARLVAFALSGFLAAFAGALFAFHQKGVHAAAYAPEVSVLMFLMVVIGGLGSVAGPLAGALAIGILDFFSASPLVTFLATGGGVVLLLLVAPGGLGQLAYDVRDAFLRGVARRAGVEDESRRERVPIAPKVAAGTAGAFVPERYRLPEQWPGELAATGDDGR
jgi:branched-chain amino acid transport system permease protein